MSGADWLLGDVGKKSKPPAKIAHNGIHVLPEEIDAVLHGVAADAKKLRSGLDAALSSLDALKSTGLTGEALVIMVTEKCGRARNGGRISPETVQLVLEGLFRLGEYVR